MHPEESTKVVIYTRTFRVEGRIALMPGARLTDFVRSAPEFIAVTEASAVDRSSESGRFKAAFLDLAKSEIELIVPYDAIRS
jgi:hypothetical protein